ncbi:MULTISPECIES: MarR family winged helix-turn-helix transcriptional regulator [Bacillus]|uniref:MarR family winged helix-turn-helix transcriptional regulator n=1 Tax=Bacillus TaxID=1386 RepID=UPI0003056EF6|nr:MULTISPECIES: MarR family transcriptional regulator [Bacillus]
MSQSHKELIHTLNQAARQLAKSFNEQFVSSGLFIAQWTVLRYLQNHGPSTQIQMCNYLKVEAPSLTRTLNRMEKQGLIIRKEGIDRRAKEIHLTPLALEKIPEWKEQVDDFENPIFDTLTAEEMETTIKVLTKIVSALQKQ